MFAQLCLGCDETVRHYKNIDDTNIGIKLYADDSTKVKDESNVQIKVNVTLVIILARKNSKIVFSLSVARQWIVKLPNGLPRRQTQRHMHG